MPENGDEWLVGTPRGLLAQSRLAALRRTTPGVPPAPARAPGATATPCPVCRPVAAERGRGWSVSILGLRRAAIRSLHFIARLPVPTAEAQGRGVGRHAARGRGPW